MELSCKLFILVLLPIACCSADSIYEKCGKNFSDTNNLLQENINHALFGLLAKTPLYGFATASYGFGYDIVYGLTRCRGDISPEACSACIVDAAEKIRTVCPFSAETRIWYEYCFLRYDTRNFLGQVDMSYTQYWYSGSTATDPVAFDQAVGELMGAVIATAASVDKKFGWGESLMQNNTTLYGMAQCTRDLQESACSQCLENLSEAMSKSCRYNLGCYMISTSCVLRLEIYKFLIGPAAAPSPSMVGPY